MLLSCRQRITRSQTRYMSRPSIQCIFSAYHFHVTSCRTDSGKFCTAALLVMKIKLKNFGQYSHICFENYLLNWIERGSTFLNDWTYQKNICTNIAWNKALHVINYFLQNVVPVSSVSKLPNQIYFLKLYHTHIFFFIVRCYLLKDDQFSFCFEYDYFLHKLVLHVIDL